MADNQAIFIAPSILSADFGHLADAIQTIELDADYLHIDVMDGHYVPNISYGVPIVKSIRPISKLLFDVHLMITNPMDHIESFAKAGADLITVHIETVSDPAEAIRQIHQLGKKAGLSIHPDTDVSSAYPYLMDVDIVLLMTVYPGFGGQSFLPNAPERIRAIRAKLDEIRSDAILSVDGGISDSTAHLAASSGARLLVAGQAVFGDPDPAHAIRRLRKCAG
jgi:ribulose-phosphate 3-epimerase